MKAFQQVFNKEKNERHLRSLHKKTVKILTINILTFFEIQKVYKKKLSF